jgi:hypothetical protein
VPVQLAGSVAAPERVRSLSAALGAGAGVGLLGGMIGLGGAEFRLPLLLGLFGFAALQAVVVNKAMSLLVVLTALPARLVAIPFEQALHLRHGQRIDHRHHRWRFPPRRRSLSRPDSLTNRPAARLSRQGLAPQVDGGFSRISGTHSQESRSGATGCSPLSTAARTEIAGSLGWRTTANAGGCAEEGAFVDPLRAEMRC